MSWRLKRKMARRGFPNTPAGMSCAQQPRPLPPVGLASRAGTARGRNAAAPFRAMQRRSTGSRRLESDAERRQNSRPPGSRASSVMRARRPRTWHPQPSCGQGRPRSRHPQPSRGRNARAPGTAHSRLIQLCGRGRPRSRHPQPSCGQGRPRSRHAHGFRSSTCKCNQHGYNRCKRRGVFPRSADPPFLHLRDPRAAIRRLTDATPRSRP
jgi:hypothetical protein